MDTTEDMSMEGGSRMGLREDDPVFYKVQMQKLLNKARKNGLVVDYSIYDGPKERSAKILFKDPTSDECAGATITKRRL